MRRLTGPGTGLEGLPTVVCLCRAIRFLKNELRSKAVRTPIKQTNDYRMRRVRKPLQATRMRIQTRVCYVVDHCPFGSGCAGVLATQPGQLGSELTARYSKQLASSECSASPPRSPAAARPLGRHCSGAAQPPSGPNRRRCLGRSLRCTKRQDTSVHAEAGQTRQSTGDGRVREMAATSRERGPNP